ncbi:MAG: hypothetical protein HYU86_05150 [Chloroflexi bacterium]|nr:hypothetical protein [Chloroflexota bacterium]
MSDSDNQDRGGRITEEYNQRLHLTSIQGQVDQVALSQKDLVGRLREVEESLVSLKADMGQIQKRLEQIHLMSQEYLERLLSVEKVSLELKNQSLKMQQGLEVVQSGAQEQAKALTALEDRWRSAAPHFVALSRHEEELRQVKEMVVRLNEARSEDVRKLGDMEQSRQWEAEQRHLQDQELRQKVRVLEEWQDSLGTKLRGQEEADRHQESILREMTQRLETLDKEREPLQTRLQVLGEQGRRNEQEAARLHEALQRENQNTGELSNRVQLVLEQVRHWTEVATAVEAVESQLSDHAEQLERANTGLRRSEAREQEWSRWAEEIERRLEEQRQGVNRTEIRIQSQAQEWTQLYGRTEEHVQQLCRFLSQMVDLQEHYARRQFAELERGMRETKAYLSKLMGT